MTEWIEWDAFPDPPKRRRKKRRPTIEVLSPELESEPSPRIRIEVVHRYQPHLRQYQQIPPWVIAMVIFAALCWLSPFGMVVALVMGGILVTSHPMIGIALGVTVALVIIIAMRERRAGRPF